MSKVLADLYIGVYDDSWPNVILAICEVGTHFTNRTADMTILDTLSYYYRLCPVQLLFVSNSGRNLCKDVMQLCLGGVLRAGISEINLNSTLDSVLAAA